MARPTDPGYEFRVLAERVARLEAAQRDAAVRRGVYVERAEVTAVGGSMCDVVYPSGVSRSVPYVTSYAPTVGDQVLVQNSPEWSGVVGAVSAT